MELVDLRLERVRKAHLVPERILRFLRVIVCGGGGGVCGGGSGRRRGCGRVVAVALPFEGGVLALDPPEVNGGRVRRGLRLFFFGSGSNVLRLLRAGWTRHDSEDLRKALDRQYANDGEKLKTHRGHRRV